MFEKWFKKKNVKADRPVLLCIHGFGKRRTDEYLNLYNALSEEYDIVMPNLFDQNFKNDTVWYNWVSRAEEEIIKLKNQNRKIILIGFSMGGVIASYLASKHNVERLVLIAPAFEYLTLTTAKTSLKSQYQKAKKVDRDPEYVDLPPEFTATFMDVVDNCKEGIENVHCPVLFMAAIDDDVIPYTVSLKYYKKVPHEAKKCVIFADGCHRILDDHRLSKMAIEMIRDFIQKKTTQLFARSF